MSGLGQELFLWAATAWLHGLCLFALVWIVQALGLLKNPALAQTAWRAVVVAPLLSAAMQVFVLHGAPVRLTLPLTPPAHQPASIVEAAVAPSAVTTPVAAPAAASAPKLSELLLTRAVPAIGWAWVALAAVLALRMGAQQLSLIVYRPKAAQ